MDALTVRPIAGAIGAEIGGLDLTRGLPDAALRAALRAAWLRHQVIVLRD